MNKVYIRIPNSQFGNTFNFRGFCLKSFYAKICTNFSKKMMVGGTEKKPKDR